MKKVAYIAFNKRSSLTGKALFELLKAEDAGGFTWRHVGSGEPKLKPDLILRWGNSTLPTKGAKELNTQAAVRNAADKGKMMEILSKTTDIRIPQYIPVTAQSPRRLEGNWFVRNEHDHIQYRNTILSTDKYAVQEINKTREFRVHVFNDTIIGVYEKLPRNTSDKIYKAENCDFRRIDTADKEQASRIKGVRPMAKVAVKALGLLFGGVDVILDASGNVYVLEVNSSPSLNGPNLQRWIEAFNEYLGVHSAQPDAVTANAPRIQEQVAPVQEPEPVREPVENVTRWLREQAANRGYSITSITLS
jgi:hypothetical protein